ncbi:hypothetical protein CWATWH8502_4197 [Crocosphaera watsonii WH 8502]|uniref:Uncharacterized protein n=1 Tax=Crocosphaera watsonii WH 8502 TaxID=423474 RepID=T2IBU2_CROWT|nr:hypothetical protein CWATWH8502_4197 [Crocosphaera watsonii WH 8502]
MLSLAKINLIGYLPMLQWGKWVKYIRANSPIINSELKNTLTSFRGISGSGHCLYEV